MGLGFNFFHYTLVREEAIVVDYAGKNWTPVPLSIDRPLLVCITSFFLLFRQNPKVTDGIHPYLCKLAEL